MDAKNDWHILQKRKCSEILSKETIDNSSGDTRFGEDDLTFCLDPENAYMGKYSDSIGSSGERVTFNFEECRYIDEAEKPANLTCKTEAETIEWFNKYAIRIDFYESKTKIDFSEQVDYTYQQVEFLSRDYIEIRRFKQRKTILRLNELNMHDSIIDPL